MSGAALRSLGATLVVGVGQGLTSPTISGLLSRVTPASEQGAVFGTLSSAQTLSRMVSYTVANLILAKAGPAGPYWVACAIAAVALVFAIVVVGPMGKPEVDRDFDDSDAPSAEAVAPRS